jgi:tight adherence protein B
MALAVLTFVVSLAVMMGLYWAFVLRPETQRSRDLARRVQRLDATKSADTTVAAPVTAASVADALLASRVSLAARLQELLAEAAIKWTVAGFLARTALAAAGGALLGAFATGRLVGAALGFLCLAIPYALARRRRDKRLREFEEQFPEAIDLIARSLRAGHTFTTGLGIAADEIPPPVGLEFRRVHDEQNFGMALPDALKAMARRVPVLDARFFVTAVLTQREAGGNLAEVLDNLSTVMRDRFKVRRQIRVVSAHGRITAWVLTLMPPVLAVVLYLVSPQFMRVLIDDPLGVRLVFMAVVLQVLGTFIIARLVDVEY